MVVAPPLLNERKRFPRVVEYEPDPLSPMAIMDWLVEWMAGESLPDRSNDLVGVEVGSTVGNCRASSDPVSAFATETRSGHG